MTSGRRDFLLNGALTALVSALASHDAIASPREGGKNRKALDKHGKSGTTGSFQNNRPSMGAGDPRRPRAFKPLPYDGRDELTVADGFTWYSLVRTGEVINSKGDRAGDCCDYLHFNMGSSPDQAFLWINHEYVLDNVLYGRPVNPDEKSKEQVDAEMKLVGGSYVELKKVQQADGAPRWMLKSDSNLAFRLDANTPIPLVGPAGGRTAIGTLANCSGGYTPWGTILTAEENFDVYFKKNDGTFRGYYGWGKYYPRNEEDYGWVVEVDPVTQKARKLTALGRFAHEGATVAQAKDGRMVVYLGDDAKGQCIYKFISKGKITGNPVSDADLLVQGDLYVANLSKGEWILLSPENPALAKSNKFSTLAEVMTHTREAAKIAGGTRLNRPEDIKIDPTNGDVYFALTNNSDSGDMHGSVNLIREHKGDFASLTFDYETFVVGGLRSGISCPDNLTFGPAGTFWATTDMSASAMGRGALTAFKRNSMHRLESDRAGSVFARHFVQAPRDAELTGPCFLPDGSGLLLSVQHPGESSFEKEGVGFTSHWPDGGQSAPVSTVVCIVPTDGKKDRFIL
ncbi:MAG: hypothetical protein RLZZ488_538 [Pseudomonadota bacterium]|jgi:secreted PhoX family phosphatase